MKRQFITPSTLGIVLIGCLFLIQASGFRVLSESMVQGPGGGNEYDFVEVERSYGIPPLLTITSRGPSAEQQGPRTVRVGWAVIGVSLLVWWCLVMPIARWITGYVRRDGAFAGPRHTGWSHPAAIIGYVLAGSAVVGAIAGVVMERTFGSPVSLAEMILGFAMMLMILGVVITLIVMIVRRWRHRTNATLRGFAVEMPAAASDVAGVARPQ